MQDGNNYNFDEGNAVSDEEIRAAVSSANEQKNSANDTQAPLKTEPQGIFLNEKRKKIFAIVLFAIYILINIYEIIFINPFSSTGVGSFFAVLSGISLFVTVFTLICIDLYKNTRFNGAVNYTLALGWLISSGAMTVLNDKFYYIEKYTGFEKLNDFGSMLSNANMIFGGLLIFAILKSMKYRKQVLSAESASNQDVQQKLQKINATNVRIRHYWKSYFLFIILPLVLLFVAVLVSGGGGMGIGIIFSLLGAIALIAGGILISFTISAKIYRGL